MNIALNSYHYSYAHTIGSVLKQPLFKLISTVAITLSGRPFESLVWRITKIAFHCLIAVVCFIPAGASYLVGKMISSMSKTQIDHESLHLAPHPVQIPQEVASDGSIDICELSKKFNLLNMPETILPGKVSKQKTLFGLCNQTAKQDSAIYPDDPQKRELFCKQLSNLLKGIIKKLESGEISKDQESDLLIELAEASTRCYPTWLESATKLFAEIHGQSETAEVKLLRLVQEYKENVILEFCQTEAHYEWHALNYVRNQAGIELGLDTTLNTFDPYAEMPDPIFGKNLIKWLFLQLYENTNRLTSTIQTRINSKNYDATYYDFLVSIVKQQGIENPNDYITQHFYDENYKLTPSGIHLLLRSIGILK